MNSIRQFKFDEGLVYKDLRLAALAEAPDAFGSTVAAERQRCDANWTDFLNQGIDAIGSMPMLALHRGEAVGLAWGKMDSLDLSRAYLYQMWVHPDFRGLGIARDLMTAFKVWALGLGASSLALDVAIENSSAYGLYHRFGFRDSGQLRPLRQGSQLQVQPMICSLV